MVKLLKRKWGTLPLPPLPFSASSLPFVYSPPRREAAPENQLGSLGSAVSSPNGARGEDLASNALWCILSSKIALAATFLVIYLRKTVVSARSAEMAFKKVAERGSGALRFNLSTDCT